MCQCVNRVFPISYRRYSTSTKKPLRGDVYMKGRGRKSKKKMKRKKTANADTPSEVKSYSFRCFLVAALVLLGFVAVVQHTSFFDSPPSPMYQVDSDDPTASTIVYTNDDGKQDQTDETDQPDRNNPALRGEAKTTENDDTGKQAVVTPHTNNGPNDDSHFAEKPTDSSATSATPTTTTTTATTTPFVATLKDDGTFEEPPKGGQVLRILVLTYSRPKSLQRLLTSLNKADYRDDTIHLDIWIDRKTNQPPDEKTIRHSETTCKQWQYGTCTVHVRSKNVGLQVQWLTSWNDSIQKMKSGAGLTKDTKEIALILEDDLKVSKHYWRWLKFCHASYGSRKDFAGCTLQRASLCAKRCAVLKGGPSNAGSNFMYPLLGSWGYSPGAAHWTRFTAWTKEFIASGKKPYVNGLTPTDWYVGALRCRVVVLLGFCFFCFFFLSHSFGYFVFCFCSLCQQVQVI